MNLLDLFSIALLRSPSKPVLHYIDEQAGQERAEVTLTYSQLFDQVERLAAGFAAWGLKKGDRVAFFIGNRPEFVVAYLAVIRLGAIMVPMNLRYRRGELLHILHDCTPRLLLTEAAHLPILDDAGVKESSIEQLLTVEEFSDWDAGATVNPATVLSGPLQDAPLVCADDLAMILYTSGTTGRSKGAMISHNNILATVTGLLSAWAWEPDDRLLLCLPLFHTHGLIVGLHCALAAGATILLREKYLPGATLRELGSGEVSLFFGVPTVYSRLVEELRSAEQIDLARMRLFCSGSAPLDPETFSAFHELTGHTILERYGMTETGMNLSNPYAGARVPGSVGLPLPGVSMRIVNHAGEDVSIGEEGELWVRGSNVFGGYWQDGEKTAQSFCQDSTGVSWFCTGDLARQDPATGYVTLLGRKHELIISGGFNIYPREIEELLLTCPGVVEVAVVGRPDAEWGESPVAYLICTGEVSDEVLTGYCRANLASFKTPKAFVRVESLPRNAMGKLQKHLLR